MNKTNLGSKTKELWKNPEYRQIMIDKHKGKIHSGSFKKGHKNSNTGRTHFTSERMTGEKNPQYKNGVRLHNFGYKYILVGIKKYENESRLVIGKFLGRPMKRKEIAHHIDKNTVNNSPENLFYFKHQTAHLRWHSFIKRHQLKPTVLISNLYA